MPQFFHNISIILYSYSVSFQDKEIQILPTLTDASETDDIEDVDSPSSPIVQPQPKKTKSQTPGMQPPRSKKQKISEIHAVEHIVDKLHAISQNVKPAGKNGSVRHTSDELSHFGEYVSAQLGQLNPIDSLNAQKAIQDILIAARIKSLNRNMQIHRYSSLSPTIATSVSGSDRTDVEDIHYQDNSNDLLSPALQTSFLLETDKEQNDSDNFLVFQEIVVDKNNCNYEII